MFGLRLGQHPRAVVTTTPKPAHPLLKDLLSRETTAVTTGSTYENRANLAAGFFTEIIRKYEGTSLGQQELEGILLEEAEGALWRRVSMIDAYRIEPHEAPEDWQRRRVCVAVDPAASSNGAETGIIVACLAADGHGYVLADRTVRGSPDTWATAAVRAYHEYQADVLVAEKNQGGEMVAAVLGTAAGAPPVKLVHASRGKQTRAEPVARLYEQGKVHHCGGFPQLEQQMVSWVPGEDSPDRMDALVWALSELMIVGGTIDAIDSDLADALAGYTGY
jgi:phage terminase large subunit-like protein